MVAELAEPFRLRQPTISKHLEVLEDAGFVTQSRDAQRRPRRLVHGALEEVDAWLGVDVGTGQTLDNLVAYVQKRPN